MRLIDADMFVEWLDVGHLRSPGEVCFSELSVKKAIDLQPTIEAERVRHGEWDDEHKCTICKAGCVCFVSQTSEKIYVETPRCPSCGTMMDGGEQMMNANDYQRAALRTDTKGKGFEINGRLLNGLMGLNGESGECIDILKKHMFHGHDLDREHLAEELGDVAWYLAVSAAALDYTLDDILRMNIEKLMKRYPHGFSEERSRNRNGGDGE